jgi:o-succinylbenzoate synthase
MKAHIQKHLLEFKNPSGTSRGILTTKETWFLIIEKDTKKGVGECGMLRGLSIDDRPDFDEKLEWTCQNIDKGCNWLWDNLIEFPAIQFGVEMAFLSLKSKNPFVFFPSEFTNFKKPIAINGLVWMGDEAFMKQQIEEKIDQGFRCIKLKIGAINFDAELQLLKFIRHHFSANEIEIRVDANGAFNINQAASKLKKLSEFELHSIEQPIAKKNSNAMAELCKTTPIPIALDEELIGVFSKAEKETLLLKIKPQYIILKPSFIGGFKGTQEWISIAESLNIKWWITSALESNVGLNAISQWTFLKQNPLPQGLGTGALYTNNIDSPLEVVSGKLWYDSGKNWNFKWK